MLQSLFSLIESVIAPMVVHLLEFIGIFIVTIGSFQAFYILIKTRFDWQNSSMKIILAEALSLSLEFKLGAEIIKTVLVNDMEELLTLGLVVIIRVVLAVLIHWELQQIEREDEARRELEAKNK